MRKKITKGEKYFRKWLGVGISASIENQQCNVIDILNAYIDDHEKIKIPSGKILVSKKALVDHCEVIHSGLNSMDKIMQEKESHDRGKNIARVCNEVNMSLHRIEHFELGVPLSKLGTSYPKNMK